MSIIKKSFDLTGDIAQLIDDYVKQNPGMSFTLIANQALEKWLCSDRISIEFQMPTGSSTNTIKKSVNFKSENIERIDKLKTQLPGINATLILNVAINEWLKNPQFATPKPVTESDIAEFLESHSELMDELAK